MPIRKVPQKTPQRAVKAASTYDGVGGDVKIDQQSDFDLENNMSPSDMLIDPEDDEAGSLYTSVTASRKVKAETDEQNVGTLPNDENPAAGYLENASEFDVEVDEDEDMIGDEAEEGDELAAGLDAELTNNDQAETLVVSGEDEDWDEEPSDGDDGDDDIDLPNDNDGIDEDTPAFEDQEPEAAAAGEDEMSMLDIDEVDDADNGDMHFATAGTRLLVIKGNRIIASMTERMAKATGREDVYLTDQFSEVTASEIRTKGLRKGLKAMGLVEARAKVGGSVVVKAMVRREVTKTTAAVRQVASANADAMDQALAIASVGINRGYFAKQSNVLREALESMLTASGMRHAKRALSPIFASVGPEYAKQVLTLAQKIAAMPQEARDGYVEALDLTSDDIDEVDEDVVPIGADEMDEEDDFADVEPATLATAGVARGRRVVQAGTMSVLASSILNGNAPLF